MMTNTLSAIPVGSLLLAGSTLTRRAEMLDGGEVVVVARTTRVAKVNQPVLVRDARGTLGIANTVNYVR